MSDVLLLNANGLPISMVPLSVITWQKAMYLIFLEKVEVIKEYTDWTVSSQHKDWKVPSIVIMTQQVHWQKELKYSRANVFLRDDFTCQLQYTSRCKDQKGKTKLAELTLDHVVPRSSGGKTAWVNVCTSCKECNAAKGANHTILPMKVPKKPGYYEILKKRKTLPIYIRDEEWKYYIGWPEDLVRLVPQPGPKVKNDSST
jgi:5-methylcytosine-specific restriction endonuclease McrA